MTTDITADCDYITADSVCITADGGSVCAPLTDPNSGVIRGVPIMVSIDNSDIIAGISRPYDICAAVIQKNILIGLEKANVQAGIGDV